MIGPRLVKQESPLILGVLMQDRLQEGFLPAHGIQDAAKQAQEPAGLTRPHIETDHVGDSHWNASLPSICRSRHIGEGRAEDEGPPLRKGRRPDYEKSETVV